MHSLAAQPMNKYSGFRALRLLHFMLPAPIFSAVFFMIRQGRVDQIWPIHGLSATRHPVGKQQAACFARRPDRHQRQDGGKQQCARHKNIGGTKPVGCPV